MTAEPDRRLHLPEDNRRIDALKSIAASGNANLGFNETLEQISTGISQAMQGNAGSLLLLNDKHADLVTKLATGENHIWTYQVELDWAHGLVERQIQDKKSLLVNDISACPEPNLFRAVPGLRSQSLLCVPLANNDHILGAIAVHNKRGGPFNDFDQELLEILSVYVARIVDNARLIQRLKVANADLEANRWQLFRSRNTLRALFDSIPASIYIIDRKYALVAINKDRAKKANSSPSSLVGPRCYEVLYQRNDVCAGCRVLETLFGGESTVRTKRIWETEESPQEWEINTYPIYDDNGEVIQAILLEQNVTERRRLEATIAQSEKLAAVGQLAAGIAHEINNPLTAVIANAQLLQRGIAPNDNKQELIDLIIRAGGRASQIVRTLLDLTRQDQFELVLTDVNETLNNALALTQHEMVSHAVTLTFDPSGDLPRIKANQDRLQGVWLNLCMNAIDAMDGCPGEIRISTRLQGNEIHVTVADTGKGIPPERISRIFDPFYTTKSPGRGTGLGLSICHRVVKQHGGHILVNSQIGIGTEFTVVLPIN